MPNLTGYPEIFQGNTDATSSVQEVRLGTRAFDYDGNEYIYLQGVASTGKFNLVSYDEAGVTTRSLANALGRCAIAMSTTVASEYGWYQIYGKGTVSAVAGVTADRQAYLTSTAGSIGTTDVAGDFIVGMITRSAVASGSATVEINYPIVHDGAID